MPWSEERQSDASGQWTPRFRSRSGAYDHSIPVPPLSMSNAAPRRRPKSHSFSTVSEHTRSPTGDVNDIQLLINGRKTSARPKSSIDLSGGYLDLHIPHYRLGTPRFSERGTAYLHSSLYSSTTTDDMRSSVFSHAEYDKIFPTPPGRAPGNAMTRASSSSYLQPGAARYSVTPSRTPPSSTSASPLDDSGGMSVAIFDKVEANPNDPAIVRYHALTGKIAAATPARLVAQITSPLFLDYELLSDFFLTFRAFITCQELLEYLMARMKWAMGRPTDAGRIVRVRTFVALRHWILNYFSDDFLAEFSFRQRFCELVNGIATQLRQRPDKGGGDLNIIGELKKCWRRTCAMFWPVTDALDTSSETDISPAGSGDAEDMATGLPIILQPKRSKADFRRISAPVQLPDDDRRERNVEAESGGDGGARLDGRPSTRNTRTASIPTSPMSEESLQVLSCSVPFLRHIRPSETATERGAARPAALQKTPPLSGPKRRPGHQHKTSGSFSDALRDGRAPLPSNRGEPVDLRSLPSMTFIGGLVRGLLLQPSPPKIDLLAPISPPADGGGARVGGIDDSYFEDRSTQNLGVKRLVGDVRRALSGRKGRSDSPARSHQSTPSSGSHSSANLIVQEKNKPSSSSSWQQLGGAPRVDVLGVKIGDSYKEAFHDANLPDPADEEAHRRLDEERSRELGAPVHDPALSLPHPHPGLERWNSRVTTGDRSIVIVDDTGLREVPTIRGALPSVSTMSSVMAPQSSYRPTSEDLRPIDRPSYGAGRRVLKQSASFSGESRRPTHSSDIPMHDLLSVPEAWAANDGSAASDASIGKAESKPRKSSSAHPLGLEMPPVQHQLRRRPGGDLKAADHVHELQTLARPRSTGSLSTASRYASGVYSKDLSGTHFPGQDFSAWHLPTTSGLIRKRKSTGLLDTHSSQPNLRPSFQAEVSQLAKLPGWAYDGGIEEALRKLEGKNATTTESACTRPSSDMAPLTRQDPRHGPLRVINASVSAGSSSKDDEHNIRSPRTETQGASIYRLSGSEATEDFRLQSLGPSDVYGRSEAQDPTTPVLPGSAEGLKFRVEEVTPGSAKDAKLHLEDVKLTGSPGRLVSFAEQPMAHLDASTGDRPTTRSDSAHKSGTSQGSFLLDDDESLSDISTEIADHSGDDGLGVRSFFFDETADDVADFFPKPVLAPPTPPSTIGAPPDASPQRKVARPDMSIETSHHLKEAQSAPKLLSPNLDQQRVPNQLLPPAELRRIKTAPGPHSATHLPFVLAFESETVAEQLTIVEKDALDEIDWKDLIGMNWQQSPSSVRNWVQFLKQDGCTGVDIVVARFNLVVKWVVSECLLTDAPSERARCIMKFIHVATHCRRFRNYASTYQITLGLLSADLARLHKTWALVAPAEKQMLERLEKLCQPVRNFSNLRQEMETTSLDAGCVPFIGLYTHDLMFNAQKSARVTPTPPTREPLVNFERYQTAATIVKNLLRLIEASSKYIFHPHPEALSRCLWLAALEDEEIVSRSKGLE